MMDLPEKLPITSVKKFYFLKYFNILLECVLKYSDENRIFEEFKKLKQKNQLGESKYRRNISEGEFLTDKQANRYRYTFSQVMSEAKEYDLVLEISESDSGIKHYILGGNGTQLLLAYKEGSEIDAHKLLLSYMEETYGAFRSVIEFLYTANEFRKGLLILPSYSPSQLGLEKSSIKTGRDLLNYLKILTQKFHGDFEIFLGNSSGTKFNRESFDEQIRKLIQRLQDAGLFPEDIGGRFKIEKYNLVIQRIRDFWLSYFLKEIYRFNGSLPSFDIWTYRGKQVGLIHPTEFYPSFSGRIVYPTSIITGYTANKDFEEIYCYEDGKRLYVHNPSPLTESNQGIFVEKLYNAYLDLKRTYRSHYINIPPLREKVCYTMKISESLFESFLSETYKLNLQGKLPFFNISLEVDRMPEETTAMYIKQEPITIDGQFKNIIAIDMIKGER